MKDDRFVVLTCVLRGQYHSYVIAVGAQLLRVSTDEGVLYILSAEELVIRFGCELFGRSFYEFLRSLSECSVVLGADDIFEERESEFTGHGLGLLICG